MEHQHTLQTKQRARRQQGSTVLDTYYRFSCSCGTSTRWRKSLAQARRERDRHAFDGQREHDNMPPWPDCLHTVNRTSRLRPA